jgi:hypothetical protein
LRDLRSGVSSTSGPISRAARGIGIAWPIVAPLRRALPDEAREAEPSEPHGVPRRAPYAIHPDLS